MRLARADAGQIKSLFSGERAVNAHLEYLDIAADGAERRTKLVRQCRQEFRLASIRRFRRVARHLRIRDTPPARTNRTVPAGQWHETTRRFHGMHECRSRLHRDA